MGKYGKNKDGYDLQGKKKFAGLPIDVEQRKGGVRTGTDKDGNEWKTKMLVPYGYIRNTKGADGDEVDVFLGPNPKSESVYIIHQVDPETQKYDEDKVMLGFDGRDNAYDTYMKHYDSPAFYGSMTTMPLAKFKKKLKAKKGEMLKSIISTDDGKVIVKVPHRWQVRIIDPTRPKKVYFDLDGVMADFDAGIRNLPFVVEQNQLGESIESMDDLVDYVGASEAWKMIAEADGFYENLPWMPEVDQLWQHVQGANLGQFEFHILTAPGGKTPAEIDACKKQKLKWVSSNIGPNVSVIFSPADEKHEFADKDSILVDDRLNTVKRWEAAGGIGVHYTDEVDALSQLNDYL